MKSAGKARNNGLYRHIRTSKEIIRNLLNDSMKSKNSQKTERLFTGRISNQTSCSQTDYLQMGEKFVRSRR